MIKKDTVAALSYEKIIATLATLLLMIIAWNLNQWNSHLEKVQQSTKVNTETLIRLNEQKNSLELQVDKHDQRIYCVEKSVYENKKDIVLLKNKK